MERSDRPEQSSRRTGHGCPPPQRRPMMVPSIGQWGHILCEISPAHPLSPGDFHCRVLFPHYLCVYQHVITDMVCMKSTAWFTDLYPVWLHHLHICWSVRTAPALLFDSYVAPDGRSGISFLLIAHDAQDSYARQTDPTTCPLCFHASSWSDRWWVEGRGCNALIGVSLEITMENNSEGILSPVKDAVYYGRVARRRKCSPLQSEDPYGTWSGKERQEMRERH